MIARSAADAPPSFGITVGTGAATDRELALLELARRYLAAIEAGTGGGGAPDGALAFYHPDVVQEELPNRLVPTGARRDLAALREAGARGRQVLRAQRYEVRSALAAGDRVALELVWVGTLAVPLGTIPAGGEMRAHFGVFLDYRGDLIVGQRNYDCFELF
jgi:ketosteroid isomerase-like protein